MRDDKKHLTFIPDDQPDRPLSPEQRKEMEEAERFYQQQKHEFIADLKLVMRKHFRRGNLAVGENDGRPSDWGFLDDMDMTDLLSHASKSAAWAIIDFLYELDPRPKPMTPEQAEEWLELLTEES